MGWMHEFEDDEGHVWLWLPLSQKNVMCLNELSLVPSLSWMNLLIDWTWNLFSCIFCYPILGCRSASSTEAGFKANLSQIWGTYYQGKFVPNLGDALGKNVSYPNFVRGPSVCWDATLIWPLRGTWHPSLGNPWSSMTCRKSKESIVAQSVKFCDVPEVKRKSWCTIRKVS